MARMISEPAPSMADTSPLPARAGTALRHSARRELTSGG